MPARSKSQLADTEHSRQVLQAIVLADSFTTTLRPVTLDKPKVLLPLVNSPMIEYTLEWLASAGVEEVFVFCCVHSKQIVEYLQSSRFNSHHQPFQVHPIVSTSAMSAGEALRFIDERQVVRSDFVLVFGDTVSNMSLTAALAAHRARREADKQAVMTICARPLSPEHRERRLGDSALAVAVDPETSQVLAYKEAYEMGLDPTAMQGRKAVQVRGDLMDCHIDICAPEVLYLFTDNFDYQHIRQDFVCGLLHDEIMGNKIYLHELAANEYAARVHNLRSYDAVSRDIIQRWVYPLVPDANLLCGTPRRSSSNSTSTDISHSSLDGDVALAATSYRHYRSNIYKESGVSLARSAIIRSDTVIGAGTVIGERTTVARSVIGRDCVIAEDVMIDSCYLFDGVRIAAGARLTHSMVGDAASVGGGAELAPGCVLAAGVAVGRNARLAARTVASLSEQPAHDSEDEWDDDDDDNDGGSGDDDDDDESDDGGDRGEDHAKEAWAAPVNARESAGGAAAGKVAYSAELGEGGRGYCWLPRDEQDRANRERLSLVTPPRELQLAGFEQLAVEDERGDDDDGDDAGGGGGSSDDDDDDDERGDDFIREVQETFIRAVQCNIKLEDVTLEINGLKYSFNKTFADCASGLCLAFFALAKERAEAGATHSPKEALIEIKKVGLQYGPLLQRFIKNDDDQVEVLLTIEELCFKEEERAAADGGPPPTFSPVFQQVLTLLYNLEEFPVEEEGIVKWASEKEFADEADKVYLKKAAQFLQWLENAEEEEDDEDEEE
mmetsp:Transcript_6093/g.22353  ORF Transcript_6093/g.22353 Transcript_6093/m.22353 type:complete len:781 (-) Transcript_6093:399-2741(-)